MVAAREASALMGSAGTGDTQAASSGKAGGGGKGGDGGALLLLPPLLLLLQGRAGGAGGQAPASCSKRTWFCSCCSFRGSLESPCSVRHSPISGPSEGRRWALRAPPAAPGRYPSFIEPRRSVTQ